MKHKPRSPLGSGCLDSDTETWKTDVANENLTPINGFVRVPESPGLGVSLNRDELERIEREGVVLERRV